MSSPRSATRIARTSAPWTRRTAAPTGWDPRTIGTVDVVAADGRGGLAVGGELVSVGAMPRAGLAAMTPDAGTISDWAPPLAGIVRSLAVSPDGARVYVGGRFRMGDVRTQQSLAVVEAGTKALSAWGAAPNSSVWAIAPTPDGESVYLGGSFVNVGGKARRRLANLDARTGSLRPWNAAANALVRSLVLTGDEIYAAGDFTSIGGETRRGVAALDPATARATGWEAGGNGRVFALVAREDEVFVGGAFTSIGGKSRKHLAALDPGDGSATRWDPSPDERRACAGRVTGRKPLVRRGRLRADLRWAPRSRGVRPRERAPRRVGVPVAPFSALALAVSGDGSTIYVAGEGAFMVFR